MVRNAALRVTPRPRFGRTYRDEEDPAGGTGPRRVRASGQFEWHPQPGPHDGPDGIDSRAVDPPAAAPIAIGVKTRSVWVDSHKGQATGVPATCSATEWRTSKGVPQSRHL